MAFKNSITEHRWILCCTETSDTTGNSRSANYLANPRAYEPRNLFEIFSQQTLVNFLSRRNRFNTDFNDVTAFAVSDDPGTLNAGMTSPLFTQDVNPFSDSVHQQAAASSSSNLSSQHHQMSCMIGVAGSCNGAVAQMLKILVDWKDSS